MWAVMMMLAAQPFWETTPVGKWTDIELSDMLRRSPWASVATDVAPGSVPLRVYLATARPVREAEAERRRRAVEKGRLTAEDAAAGDEYREYLAAKAGSVIVLAVEYGDGRPFLDGVEIKRMEEECRMIVGKRKYKLIGHFPPTARDPFVRLVFPREITGEDLAKSRELRFDLYLPIAGAFREARFEIGLLKFNGVPEL